MVSSSCRVMAVASARSAMGAPRKPGESCSSTGSGKSAGASSASQTARAHLRLVDGPLDQRGDAGVDVERVARPGHLAEEAGEDLQRAKLGAGPVAPGDPRRLEQGGVHARDRQRRQIGQGPHPLPVQRPEGPPRERQPPLDHGPPMIR
jgi:hypothetical protein